MCHSILLLFNDVVNRMTKTRTGHTAHLSCLFPISVRNIFLSVKYQLLTFDDRLQTHVAVTWSSLFSDFNTDWIPAKNFKFPNANLIEICSAVFQWLHKDTGDDWCGGTWPHFCKYCFQRARNGFFIYWPGISVKSAGTSTQACLKRHKVSGNRHYVTTPTLHKLRVLVCLMCTTALAGHLTSKQPTCYQLTISTQR
jgi:hypothetical protein